MKSPKKVTSNAPKNKINSSRDELAHLQQLVENLQELQKWQSWLVKEISQGINNIVAARKKTKKKT